MLYTSVAIAGHDRVSALGLNPGTETVEASKLIVDTFLPLLFLNKMSKGLVKIKKNFTFY